MNEHICVWQAKLVIKKHSFLLEKQRLSRKTLFFRVKNGVFCHIIHLALINSVYRRKNFVFQSKNIDTRLINSVYQIEKQSFPINCVFRLKNTVHRSINRVYRIEKQSFSMIYVFRSKNIVFSIIMFSLINLIYRLEKLCFSETLLCTTFFK